jgi:hypothetical protein
MNVLILKPSVGLTLDMSSPLIFFRIVVLPALSSPLAVIEWAGYTRRSTNLQEKNSHFPFFLSALTNDCEQAHRSESGSTRLIVGGGFQVLHFNTSIQIASHQSEPNTDQLSLIPMINRSNLLGTLSCSIILWQVGKHLGHGRL